MNDDYIALMNVAARIARNAGDLVYVGRRNGAGNVLTKSSATDMVLLIFVLSRLGELMRTSKKACNPGTLPLDNSSLPRLAQ